MLRSGETTSHCALICKATSKPTKSWAGGEGQGQNQIDRDQTRSCISPLDTLVKILPVSGLSTCASLFLKGCLTCSTFWWRCVPSILSKAAHLEIILSPYQVYFLYHTTLWDYPDSPVVKTLTSNSGGAGLIPGQGTEIPHAVQRGQKKKKKVCKSYHAMQLFIYVSL